MASTSDKIKPLLRSISAHAVGRRSGGPRRGLFGLVLAAPAMVLIAVLIVYPIMRLVLDSFRDEALVALVGLENYLAVFRSTDFLPGLWHSVLLTSAVVAVEVVIGLGLALALERAFRGRAVIRTVFILPWPLPPFVAAFAFVWLLDYNYGSVNHLITLLGGSAVAWLGSPVTAFCAAIAVFTWKTLPWTLMTLSAGLTLVPADLREAARVDGASWWREVRHVVIPAIRPVIYLVVILRFIWTFNEFELLWLLTGGGPNKATMTLPILTYNVGFEAFQLNQASAIGVLLLVVLGTLSVAYVRRNLSGDRSVGKRTGRRS